MYGIVNQSMAELIYQSFGKEKWDTIRQASGVEFDFFRKDQTFDDFISFELIETASSVLKIPKRELLKTFGFHWIQVSARKKYGDLFLSYGNTFRDFVLNLPNLNSGMLLVYPRLNPPEFLIETNSDTQLLLHCYHKRGGSTDFIIGVLQGIGVLFDTTIELKFLSSEKQTVWHDQVLIDIQNTLV